MARTQVKSGGFVQNASLTYSVYAEFHHPDKDISALLNTGPFSNAAAGYSAWENSPHTNIGLRSPAMTTSFGSVTIAINGDEGTGEISGMTVWNGSAWLDKPARVWTGGNWLQKPAKVWNGSTWV
jgi:hypothetical protein